MFCLRFKLSFVNQDSGVFCFSFRWAGSCAEANIHKMDQLSSSKGEPSHVWDFWTNIHPFMCERKKHPKPVIATSLQSAELICHKTGGTSPGPTWTYTLISSLNYCASFYQGTVGLLTGFTYRQLWNSTALCHEKDAVSQSCVTLYLQ